MSTGSTSAVSWAWQRQSVRSQTANALKAGPTNARRLLLGCTVAGAVLALASSQLEPLTPGVSLTLGILAAIALAAVAELTRRQSVDELRRWTRARSVSEALKTEVFLFMTHCGVYAETHPGADPEHRLKREVLRMEHDARDLVHLTEEREPVERALPDAHDLESYLRVRVLESQVRDFYRPGAREVRRKLTGAKTAQATLALTAAGLGVTNAVIPNLGAWAAVLTTAAGAVAAHAAAERYEYLWIEYDRTAYELERLANLRTSADGTALSACELINECERVISIQNSAWMAKLGEDRPASARPGHAGPAPGPAAG